MSKNEILSGAFAGAFARLLCAPLDVIKIRFQLQDATKGPSNMKYRGVFQAFRTVVREEGFGALFKGNLSATYLWATYAMVQFGIYGRVKNFIETMPEKNSIIQRHMNIGPEAEEASESRVQAITAPRKMFSLFLAGAIAGTFATTMTYPFDIMRTHFVVQGAGQTRGGIPAYIKNTFSKYGIKGFYAGLPAAVIGISPAIGMNFMFYETLQSLKKVKGGDGNDQSVIAKFLGDSMAGGVAGGMSKILIYPLDTVKKRMQLQAVQNTLSHNLVDANYAGVLDCMRKTHANEGLAGFYRGGVPTTAKAMFASGLTFAAFGSCKKFLDTAWPNDMEGKI